MPVASFPLSREAIEQSLPDRYAQVVARFPDRIAVDSQGARLSYSALDEISNRWARLVLDRVAPGAVVGLLLPQGLDNVAATLGILKAGALYAPFDPSHSFHRLQATVAHAAPTLIIAASPYRDLAASLVGRAGAVCAPGDERASPADAVPSRATADSPAYLFYTSGSSGPPKGVVDTHRNVLHNVWRYTANLCITEADRLSLIQPPSFSACVSSQFCALMNGATLLPYDVRTAGLGRPLREWIQRERVTVFHAVPAIFRTVVEGVERFPDVRVVRLEGDAARPGDAALFRRHFELGAILANGLGATETGLACQHRVRGDAIGSGSLPIGFALPDVDIQIVGPDGLAAMDGATGEIAVRSHYLAAGYWKDPARTASAFRHEPDGTRTYRGGDLGRRLPGGEIEYVGRKDASLKVRGQHVDTAAVELALLSSGLVRDVVAATVPDANGEVRVVAYLVAGEGAQPVSTGALRRTLAPRVPQECIPTRFVWMERLPLNENGKVDRRRLPPLDSGRSDPAPPGNDVAARIAALFEEVVGVAPVGHEDDFFDLGGDSLDAARVTQRLEGETGVRMSPALLAEATTPRALATWLERNAEVAIPEVIVLRQGSGAVYFMVFLLEKGDSLSYAALARRLPGDPTIVALQRGSRAEGARLLSLQELAGHYWRLLKEREPAGPYRLVGYCFGGIVALEIARLAEEEGNAVRLALINVSPHDFPSLVGRDGYVEDPPPAPSSFRERLPSIAARLLGRGGLRYAGERLVSRARDVWRSAPWLLARAGNRLTGRAWPARLWTPYRRNQHAFRRHLPKPVACDIIVILPAAVPQSVPADMARRWSGLTRGRVAVHTVPKVNSGMLKDPVVGDVADALGNFLA